MKVILRSRQTGKTTDLMEHAMKNELTVVVPSVARAYELREKYQYKNVVSLAQYLENR